MDSRRIRLPDLKYLMKWQIWKCTVLLGPFTSRISAITTSVITRRLADAVEAAFITTPHQQRRISEQIRSLAKGSYHHRMKDMRRPWTTAPATSIIKPGVILKTREPKYRTWGRRSSSWWRTMCLAESGEVLWLTTSWKVIDLMTPCGSTMTCSLQPYYWYTNPGVKQRRIKYWISTNEIQKAWHYWWRRMKRTHKYYYYLRSSLEIHVWGSGSSLHTIDWHGRCSST